MSTVFYAHFQRGFRLTKVASRFTRVTEFVDALETVIDVNKNGSVWLIDGGKAKEIHCKDHWFESNAV